MKPDKRFEGYITEPMVQKVSVRQVNRVKLPSEVTLEQALDDLASFRYIIDTSYAAKEYWACNGLAFDKEYQRIAEYLHSAGNWIKIADFYEQLCQTFARGGCDGHLSLMTYGVRTRFIGCKRAYFANSLLFEKRDGKYRAVTEKGKIKRGDIVSDCSFFPALSPSGRQLYYAGVRSFVPVKGIDAVANGKKIRLPVHLIRIAESKRGNEICRHTVIDGVDIVDCPTFFDEKEYQNGFPTALRMGELGRRLRDKPVLVYDITGNRGGANDYNEQFIGGLNDYVNLEIHYAKLFSPICPPDERLEPGEYARWLKRPGERYWEFVDTGSTDSAKGTYQGQLYLLTDCRVYSSGDGTVAYCNSIPHVVRIGENTGGIVNFGGVKTYELTHTKINLFMSNCIMSGICDEGVGSEPHFWVDAPDIRSEVLRWLADREEYLTPVG